MQKSKKINVGMEISRRHIEIMKGKSKAFTSAHNMI